VWENEVEARNIDRSIVQFDDLLQTLRPLTAELRWLQLRLTARHIYLDDIKTMKQQQHDKNSNELERAYYPCLLAFYQAACSGEEHIRFAPEDQSLPKPREDIVCYIHGKRADPHENKPVIVTNNSVNDPYSVDSIDRNRHILGKLLKICIVVNNPPDGMMSTSTTRLCSFTCKIEYIWFCEFQFDRNGKINKCRVAPAIPYKNAFMADNVLCSTHHMNSCNTLSELLPVHPSNGFKLLVRYVDTILSMRGLHSTPVSFKLHNGEEIDMSHYTILAHGDHSIVFQHPTLPSIIKVSRSDLIATEQYMHNLVDHSSQYIRPMSNNGIGTIHGAGNDLSFIVLAGIGEPFQSSHIGNVESLAAYWNQAMSAVKGMHTRRVVHRDIKPENFIVIDGKLMLNDFDVACELDDLQRLEATVGTSRYRSPKFDLRYRERDDWLSLSLSFLSLLNLYSGDNPDTALTRAVSNSVLPKQMIECIITAYQ
jgi:hypothetical protein